MPSIPGRRDGTLEPDLVGEHLAATTYQDAPGVLAGVLAGRQADVVLRPVEVLSRLAADQASFAEASQRRHRGLPGLCAQAIEQAGHKTSLHLQMLLGERSIASLLARLTGVVAPDPSILADIVDAFPSRTDLMLNPLATTLTAS